MRSRRRFVVTTSSDHDGPIFPNLARDVSPTGPDQMWVADITYIAIASGFVYLAAVLDVYGLRGSMARRGYPYDNAKAESFMKTLKVEEVYLMEYETFDEVAGSSPRFLEDVYNAKRLRQASALCTLHSALGYRSLVAFEKITPG